MRMLKRMVLLNSANISHTEIKLDGNVHFIGTNGAGKSTLLRAVLFFYNADSMNLGIEKSAGQVSFENFYFPHPDSYIIYEVMTEVGPFMVVAYRHNARIEFRFIDTAYERSYFMDANNCVYMEWKDILNAVNDRSEYFKPVKTFHEYRNIIYGRGSETDSRLNRFYVVNGVQPGTIERVVQDIYLNKTLEADGMKNSLISSLSLVPQPIDLQKYRINMQVIKDKVEDVDKWFRKDKDGTVRVRKDAENLVGKYKEVLDNIYHRRLWCAYLNHALKRDTDKYPEWEHLRTRYEDELQRVERLLDEEEGKYKVKMASLNQTIGGLKVNIDTAAKLHKKYEVLNIQEMLDLEFQEPVLQDKLVVCNKQYETLTDKSRDIRQRYDEMKQQWMRHGKEVELAYESRVNGAAAKLNRDIQSTRDRYNGVIQQKQDSILQLTSDYLKSCDVLNQELTAVKVNISQVKSSNPYAEAISLAEQDIRKWHMTVNEQTVLEASLEQYLKEVRSEFELFEKEKSFDYRQTEQKLTAEIDGLRNEINALHELKSSWEGSLIDWLEHNVPGWESNFGKVLDEDILYNKQLEPVKTGYTDNIFGVQINLDALPKKVRTPRELDESIDALTLEIQRKEASLRQAKLEFENAVLERKRQDSTVLRKTESKKEETRAKLVAAKGHIKSLESRIERIKTEADEDRQKRLAVHEAELHRLNADKYQVEKKFTDDKTEVDNDIKKIQKSLEKAVKELQKKHELILHDLENEKTGKLAAIQDEISKLDTSLNQELVQGGVDEQQLIALNRQTESLKALLRQIQNNKEVCISYRNDMVNYFSHESEWQYTLKTKKMELDELAGKFNERKLKKQAEREKISTQLENVSKQLESSRKSVDEVRQFLDSSSCPDEYNPQKSEKTDEPLDVLFKQLQLYISGQIPLMRDLRHLGSSFKNHFNKSNTFNFQPTLENDTDFLKLSGQVEELLKGDMIATTAGQVHDLSSFWFKTIVGEVNDLKAQVGQVQKLVRDINREFAENKFTDVIQLVELQVEESSNNRLMRMLVSLADYIEENTLFFEKGLFADDEKVRHTNQTLMSKMCNVLDNLNTSPSLMQLTLADSFKLSFRVTENGNASNWVERLSGWGSEGTGIMVKTMINIVLLHINRKQYRIGRKQDAECCLHCIIDEVGKIHTTNLKGMLQFANARNILLVNGSPQPQNSSSYKRTYLLQKVADNITRADMILEQN